ncbi:hypothetical protein [Streptomyces sp. IMTB 2501]|uniref:hypothetical protein n=1 Tax=Streptomyces sp. IMTB 2501 TaxID=1776340 RepID=UPI0015B90703|nr:hypothetical protein [Streptomyces sp. IMTB 2501]
MRAQRLRAALPALAGGAASLRGRVLKGTSDHGYVFPDAGIDSCSWTTRDPSGEYC